MTEGKPKRVRRRSRWAWGTTALAGVLSLAERRAQTQVAVVEADEEVVVTATRVASDPFQVPVQTTVITAEDIEAQMATDIKDVIRFEPGVSVPTSPARFSAAFSPAGRDGNSGFSIRGMGGNRVLFVVDGVRVPDGFSFGPAAFGRGDYVDLDLVQTIEIVRGPASALYGSDGLAGTVSFTTKDPRDFLYGDEPAAARVRLSYASADESLASGVSAAGLWGDWSGLIAYTHREGHEQENQGDNFALDSTRTAPNPQDIESNAVMGRLVFQPNASHRFRITADYGDRDIVTEVLTGRAPLPPASSTSVLDLDGLDTSERARLGVDYTWLNQGGLVDRAFVSLYTQRSELYQFSAEDRNTAADRTRITTFDTDVTGGAVQFDSVFNTGAVEHRLIYGGDLSVTRQEGIRDGMTPPTGEVFPTRAFPNTDYTLAGLYIQDEISFSDGLVVLFPALRYDSYELDPEIDALYPIPVDGQSDDHFSPRLGIVAWPAEHVGVFFNYAHGFRAPSPNQVNQNFSNLAFSYTTIPNPDLRPETSDGAELGVRLVDVGALGGTWRASASAYSSWYEDFIAGPVQVAGPPAGLGTPMDPSVFQVINIGEVEIWGLESRIEGRWENGLSFRLAVAFAEGDEINGGVRTPLETIDPLRVVTGVGYDAPGGRWGGQAIVTYSARKDEDRTAAGNFRPDAFTILDLTAYVALTDSAVLRAGVFNVTDETYWWWSDVQGLGASSTIADAFTQPGRNFSVSISYRF
ncbi:MAG: TonB-dependent hemoglobin/transferrin/lactoferrin family receptor [Hyphomonadaceae bacterium]